MPPLQRRSDQQTSNLITGAQQWGVDQWRVMDHTLDQFATAIGDG